MTPPNPSSSCLCIDFVFYRLCVLHVIEFAIYRLCTLQTWYSLDFVLHRLFIPQTLYSIDFVFCSLQILQYRLCFPQTLHSVDFVSTGYAFCRLCKTRMSFGGQDFTLTLTGVKQSSIGKQKSIVWNNFQDERHSGWLRIATALGGQVFTLILAEVKQSIILEN